MPRLHRIARLAALAATLLLPPALAAQRPGTLPGDQIDTTHTDTINGVRVNAGPYAFRFIGPPGNRVSAVMGEPGNPNVYYVGGASGGIWKSEDGGINWQPVFDDMPAQSIGALAIAPSDHSIVWAGTGEGFIRSNVSLGNGIYKSVDAGRHWTHMGLERTGRIGRIIVDPHDPNIVFACAEGMGYGPQPERGVYRTQNGGATWTRVLFANDSTGCSELAMDAHNPHVLLAGMWQFELHTWGQSSGGAGSGVYRSLDGGTTWTKLTQGLPKGVVGKTAVAIAPGDPSRMYALIETGGKGSLWRSDDAGDHWHLVNSSRRLMERSHYYTRMVVSPNDADEIYFPQNFFYVSKDGGESIDQVPWAGDNHDMWADPTNADRLMIGSDVGALITTVHGKSWSTVVLPIAQIYHVAVDDRIPYFVYGNEQDNSANRGPSNTLSGAIGAGWWLQTAGCESGFSLPDPVDTTIVWGGCYEGGIERFDLANRHSHSVNPWPEASSDAPADSLTYRWNWTPPMAISPHDHNTVYVGSQVVHMTKDGGMHWTVISPDLTTNDTSRMHVSGGLTPDNLGVEYCCTLFAIAESPVTAGPIWAGSNDGLVHVTRDGGAHWADVTPPAKLVPRPGTISNIEPSRWDAGTAYLSVDRHQDNDRDPYILKTTDYGAHWTRISDGIPKSVLSYLGMVKEDPVRRGMLYAGTENGLYVTYDDGAHWYPLQLNLPHAPVTWIAVQERFDDLVLSTKGRGFWILDDLGPLQRLAANALAANRAALLPIHDAYRFIQRRSPRGVPNDNAEGKNPNYGAAIPFFVRPTEKDTTMKIVIRTADGREVRTLKPHPHPGLGRVWWDLRWNDPQAVELRANPPGFEKVWEAKRFRGKRTRPLLHYGIQQPERGPLVAPGTYTVEMTLGKDSTKYVQTVRVLKDPSSTGSDADVQAGAALALQIRDELDTTAKAINEIERVRSQLDNLRDMYGKDSTKKAMVEAAKTLDSTLVALESRLIEPPSMQSSPKTFASAMQVYEKLLFLEGQVGSGAGDVAGNPDYPPTAGEVEVHRILTQRLDAILADLHAVLARDVPEFNKAAGVRVGVVIDH